MTQIKGRLLLIHKDTLERIVQILCTRLKMTRGRLYTIKPSDICAKLYSNKMRRIDVEEVPRICYSILNDIVKETLWETLLVEQWPRGKVIVDVDKAKKLLGCAEKTATGSKQL